MIKRIKSRVYFLILGLLLLGLGNTGLYAEAAELQNVMPNSWQKVTRLTAEEEQWFIKRYDGLIETIKSEKYDESLFPAGSNRLEKIIIYRQIIGEDVIYRVLRTNTAPGYPQSSALRFVQYIIYKDKIFMNGLYNMIEVWRQNSSIVFSSIDIVVSKGQAKGILKTHLSVSSDKNGEWNKASYRKGQLYGILDSFFYLIDNVNPGYEGIQIRASDCLVDPNIPLRHSLQNAFDGDPATIYMENTEDNLMHIYILVKAELSKQFALINGYAQNEVLYRNNNRIKTIDLDGPITLADNNRSYQFTESGGRVLSVQEIYKGDKYNNTCLAEFNVFMDGTGWLFGDIDG
jgi:hypothetical protein